MKTKTKPAPRPESLGGRIRAARKAAGLSLMAAASAAGVDLSTWHRWEQAKATPDLGHLQAAAAVLGISAAGLLGE